MDVQGVADYGANLFEQLLKSLWNSIQIPWRLQGNSMEKQEDLRTTGKYGNSTEIQGAADHEENSMEQSMKFHWKSIEERRHNGTSMEIQWNSIISFFNGKSTKP